MTLRTFLDAAYVELVHEFQEIGKLRLFDAIEAAKPWAAGRVRAETPSTSEGRTAAPPSSEEQVVAQNEAALRALEARMAGVRF